MADYREEIVQALIAKLRGASAVSSLVGSRVHHTVGPELETGQNDTPARVVLANIGGPRASDMQGHAGLTIARIQCECWAGGQSIAAQVLAAVMNELEGFKGTIQGLVGSVEVDHILFDESPQALYDDDTRAHGQRVDMSVAHGGL